ncbi:MAG: type 2 isopentenyl-diphosphate Delta-isomerase [Microbacteriaceae bacterium]
MSSSRKDEHVDLAREQHDPARTNQFDELHFVHHALAGGDTKSVDTSTRIAGRNWSSPLYINAMTGGSERTGEINRMLARVANRTGVAIASGSLSVFFKHPELAPTFQVIREQNPNGFVFANVNATASPERAQSAIDLLGADALQIHLNSIQEIVMPEGDRDFSAWQNNIATIVTEVNVPVVVKEVGFGMSAKTIQILRTLGVEHIDLSGSGGTNFALIENARRGANDYSYLADWGQSTAACLLDAQDIRQNVTLLASGGVRNPLDVVKALALGARAVGVSGEFLKVLINQGEAALESTIANWIEQIAQIMDVLGVKNLAALEATDLLVTGSLREFAELRGLNPQFFARRSDTSTPEV